MPVMKAVITKSWVEFAVSQYLTYGMTFSNSSNTLLNAFSMLKPVVVEVHNWQDFSVLKNLKLPEVSLSSIEHQIYPHGQIPNAEISTVEESPE